MEVKFVFRITPEIEKFMKLFRSIEDDINAQIQNNEYGNDLLELCVGFICVAPAFDAFNRPMRPKYYGNAEGEVDGLKFKIIKVLEYEIKLSFDLIKDATEEEARKVFMESFIESLEIVKKMKKKIPDFKLDKFKEDLINPV